MATKTRTTKATKSTYDVVKANTKKWNKEFMNTTLEVVEGTIESGSQWQEIIAKGLKGSTKLMKKQQDLMLDTLEGVKKQVDTDLDRYTKLLGLEKLAERGNEVVKSIKNFAPKLTDRVEETVEKAQKTVKKVTKQADKFMDVVEDKAEKVQKRATKTVKKVSKSADKMMDVVEDKAEEMVKATKKMVKAETVTDKPANNDLKVIDGIGPKMEEILNNAGIKTIAQLKKAKAADLKAILEAAGPRYKMFNPQFWLDQAKSL
jgi:predicted flap endonuclease-1-like 5' DNA nuclease